MQSDGCNLNKAMRKLSEKVIFEQKLEEKVAISKAMWGRAFQAWGQQVSGLEVEPLRYAIPLVSYVSGVHENCIINDVRWNTWQSSEAGAFWEVQGGQGE